MGTKEEFQELTGARDILVDAVARLRYDETGEIDKDSRIVEFLGGEDFFLIFGDHLGPARGLDKHFNVHLKKSKTDEVVVIYFCFDRMVRCELCKATGQGVKKMQCSRCLGKKIEITKDIKDENGRSIELCSSICGGCSGVGYIGLGDNCKSCNGNKLKKTEKKVCVPLPQQDPRNLPHIVFSKLSDEPIDPFAVPGDVVLHVQQPKMFGIFCEKQQPGFWYKLKVKDPCDFKVHGCTLMTESDYQSRIENLASFDYHGFELPEKKASREQKQSVSAATSEGNKVAATSTFFSIWFPCLVRYEVVSPLLEAIEDGDSSKESSESSEERSGDHGVRLDQIQQTSNDMSEMQERFVQFLC
eukprot:TRINITY_DN928_c0_g1_i1.p1 TRINITY_DN928_c0_g1~~TRINITY_DN928_c0_g1_i1.p1  ORF type:complete len:395 (-),score=93.93 TRINITY_DN928_c0_g1_i1:59-1132(-)